MKLKKKRPSANRSVGELEVLEEMTQKKIKPSVDRRIRREEFRMGRGQSER